MKQLWLKCKRPGHRTEQVRLAAEIPIEFRIGDGGEWCPEGLDADAAAAVAFDGHGWSAWPIKGDFFANGFEVTGKIILYAPMVFRFGNLAFVVDDVAESDGAL